MALARLVEAPVQRQRLLGALAVGEEIGERVGQAEVRRELGAVVGAAEDPDLGRVRAERVRGDAGVRAVRRPRLQVAHLDRKVLGGVAGVRVQRPRGAHVAAGRAAEAEVDAPRRERLEDAELLGDLERAVVRQHDAGAADPDRRRARRDRRHQDLGCGADDGRQAVVLAQPEARVAEPLAVLGERERVADRGILAAAGERDRLVENREAHCRRRSAAPPRTRQRRPDGARAERAHWSHPGWVGSIQRTFSGFSTGSMSRLTATASPSLRQSTHSSTSVGLALISWCGT